ncbi:diaminopimelate decarboxylase [Conexibacter sp. W3-3-2]|uniref:diaminopimelate decarboxylase n=1 Tax=Conexibacter sp. W3-3-2 TaxID=2675227 RepID=UPI0012B6BA8D|nr:diaminopimelate decarboxylase [Conexibacter sp. W3-3-2]MTD46980.1 diaminopimelate decarboxylase [Conexibacter sp. W3-3-2]
MAAAQQLSHVWPLGTTVDERGHLILGGCDAVELAREHGTPAYVVVVEDVRARARAFVQAFAARCDDFEVTFASKAFPCTAVYRLLAGEGIGCDVAGGGELALALRGGFEPARITLHGNAKSEGELRFAREAGVGTVVLDSLHDLERLERVVAADGRGPQTVLVRVTPDVRGETHAGISTGQADSKFGLGLAAAADAIARAQASPHLQLDGLHLHIGSQLLELAPFREAVRAIAGLGDFRTYNLGGGLGVAYTADQRPPSIEDYVEAKVSAVRELLGPGRRIVDEPGRALVANAGVTLYTVETIKQNVSTWVGVDGGMSDNLRPMLYGARYEAVLADRAAAEPQATVKLTGKHCESSDVIVDGAALPTPQVGDVVATPVTGAYGHAMANNYNGALRPPIVFVERGEATVVVRRETYEDLYARDC